MGFAVLYALAMYAGRATHVPPSQLALAWPAAGVAVVWFLCLRTRGDLLLGVLMIAVVTGVVNDVTGLEPVGAWLFGLVNAAHGLAGAAVFRRLGGWEGARSVGSSRDVGLLGVASLASASVSALFGGLVAWARFGNELWDGMGFIGFRNALSTFVTAAALLAVPALYRQLRRNPVPPFGSVAVVGTTLLVSTALMYAPWPIAFGMIPPVLMVALRCGTDATAVIVGFQGVIVGAATTTGHGPFAVVTPVDARVLLAQALILVLAMVGLIVAVMEHDRAAALAASQHDRDRLRDHMEAALVAGAHLVVDADGTVRTVEVNGSLTALTGQPHESLLGSAPTSWLTPADAVVLRAAVDGLVNGRDGAAWRGQLRMADTCGAGWVDTVLSVVERDQVRDGGIQAEINLQMIDITAQLHAEQELAHAALHDELTGLANRKLWADHLELALKQSARSGDLVAALYVDIDHFKQINDTYGHDVGDQVLIEIARRISGVVRGHDTVARMGGDEFVVLCPVIATREDGHKLANRLEQTVKVPIMVNGRSIAVTASIGVGFAEPGETEARLLLRRADTALYAAKARGRARFEVYSPDLHASIERSARLLLDIERGHRAGEFFVHYQPIVDADSGQRVALEALLRWDHPERGCLRPAEFLDVLESSDLIHHVGADVLRTACADGAALVERGNPLTIHVNVSAKELARPGLVASVRSALDGAGFPAELLVLEITETRLVAVNDSLLRDLLTLRELGVRVAVDDFGTGFSTLTHLVELPVGILKLDRSFVTDIATDQSARSVSSGIRAMADGLGIEAIAEGVETAAQARILRGLGYHHLQGYYCGLPQPFDQLVDPLARAS